MCSHSLILGRIVQAASLVDLVLVGVLLSFLSDFLVSEAVLADVVSDAGLSADLLLSAGLFLKSVSYQPVPVSLNEAAVICFSDWPDCTVAIG